MLKPPWMVGDGSAGPTSHLSKVVAQLSTFKKLARLMRQIMMDGISEMRNVVLIFFKRKVKSGAAHIIRKTKFINSFKWQIRHNK